MAKFHQLTHVLACFPPLLLGLWLAEALTRSFGKGHSAVGWRSQHGQGAVALAWHPGEDSTNPNGEHPKNTYEIN